MHGHAVFPHCLPHGDPAAPHPGTLIDGTMSPAGELAYTAISRAVGGAHLASWWKAGCSSGAQGRHRTRLASAQVADAIKSLARSASRRGPRARAVSCREIDTIQFRCQDLL